MTAGGPMPAVSRALEMLARRQNLDRDTASEVLELIMGGQVGDTQTAAFLMGLRVKGETAEEIVGLAATMRRLAEPVEVGGDGPLVDVVGTGGDRLGTFNISTTAAFVVAGAGARVAKHGNRGATSRSGSADLLEALGVRIDLPPAAVARCIEEVGIGFMFAPLHHKAMRHVVPVRRDLGVRTVFNFLGPLTNPAGACRQLTGVSAPEYVEVLARALALMGCEHAFLVHGQEGMDELSVVGPTTVVEVAGGRAGTPYVVEPETFGLRRWPLSKLTGGDARQNAAIALNVLKGEAGAPLEVVLLNAGAALHVAGKAESVQEGVERARESIESGRAREKVNDLVRSSWSSSGTIRES
ncbi:MAG: anthranilate phosphoribosyltransferase [Thermoleophilia bacterium]|nr:anthranilate phosphoribosyltransferase [Thermoleophilia bacterium]